MANSPVKVHARELTPIQRPTPVGFKRHADCYERCMLKHPHRSVFHSLAELYHAALLEADPSVISYVPQPFSLRVGKRPYLPDCYVVQNGLRRVIELKPRGEFGDELRIPLKQFFARHGMQFEVIPNEVVLERQVEAENWLTIISCLYVGRHLDCDADEMGLLETLSVPLVITLGELIDPGDRLGSNTREIALFRLLHRGQVNAALASAPLDYSTEFSLCN